jgi:hypothetical protein
MQTTSITLMNLRIGHLRIPWFTCNRTTGQSDEFLGCRRRGCLEWGYLLSGGPCTELSLDLLRDARGELAFIGNVHDLSE